MAGPTITTEQIEAMVAVASTLNPENFVDADTRAAVYLAKSLVRPGDKPGDIAVIPFVITGEPYNG